MNTDMNKSRNRIAGGGQFAAWAAGVAAVVMIVITVAVCWRIFAGIRAKYARPEQDGSPIGLPPAAQPAEDQANWSRARFTVKAGDGVRQTSRTSWSVKGGRAFMQVRDQGDGSQELRFVYPFDDWLPGETIALCRTRWSLDRAEPIVGQLNITPEQLARLQTVPPSTDIPVESGDRQQLSGLFNDYLSASDKPAAEAALVEALVAMDGKYYERTMQIVENMATLVRQVFTDEQWAGLAKRFGPPGTSPGTRTNTGGLTPTGRPTRQ